MAKIMEIIAKETGGKSYHTMKYSLDYPDVPSFAYDDDGNKIMKWQKRAETVNHKAAIDLSGLAKELQGQVPLLTYFLDGSRHVYKVDDISYNKQVYPVLAGQIGVGCCRRENGIMKPEQFYPQMVMSLPKECNFDLWRDDAFFAAKTIKINESSELRRLV